MEKTCRGLTCRFRFMPRPPWGEARLSKYPEASGAHGAGRPAHRIALSCFQRGPGTLAPGLARACPLLSATVSRRRGAYFKPATRDCKSPAEDFSNLFSPSPRFPHGGRQRHGGHGGQKHGGHGRRLRRTRRARGGGGVSRCAPALRGAGKGGEGNALAGTPFRPSVCAAGAFRALRVKNVFPRIAPCLPPIFGKSGRDSRRRGSFFSLRGLVCEFPWIYIKAIVPSEGKEGAGPLFWGRNSRSPSNTLAGFLRRDAESRPVLFAFRGVAWREWSPRARGLGHLRTPPPSSRGGRTRDFAGLTFFFFLIGCGG